MNVNLKSQIPADDCDLDFDDDLYDDMTNLLRIISETEETQQDMIFAEHGYTKVDKICNTLQGELIKAKTFPSSINFKYVAIKKICKKLTYDKIAYEYDQQSNSNIHFCVEEDIRKESLILKHLTLDNQSTFNYIVQFIEFFESKCYFYMVMEYVEGLSLKEFIKKAHQYIFEGKLRLVTYQKVIKFIMWQLIATFQSLHDVYHCM